MKKLLIISSVFIFMIGLGFVRVFAAETTTANTTHELKSYTYVNYQDLVDQIEADMYEEIYEDVYNDIYQDVMNQFDQSTYDQIYAEIEIAINEQLAGLALVNDETQNQIYDVVDIANQTVIGVENYLDEDGLSIGSGVIYDYDETEDLFYIITNYHVIEDGNNFKIRLEDESSIPATLVKYDADMDIALLSFSAAGLEGLEVAILGSSSDLTKGQIIIAVGHPEGFNFYNSVTFGVVAGLDRSLGGESITFIQIDAAINGGNSGGPIFNLDGEVVGINVIKFADEEIEGMGFSIPIDIVVDFINS